MFLKKEKRSEKIYKEINLLCGVSTIDAAAVMESFGAHKWSLNRIYQQECSKKKKELEFSRKTNSTLFLVLNLALRRSFSMIFFCIRLAKYSCSKMVKQVRSFKT